MAYTLEQLQKMGAKPVAPTASPSGGQKYTFEQLQSMGAKPVASVATPPAPVETSGASFPASANDSAITAGLKTAGNLPGSAWNFAKGVVSSMNPVTIGKNAIDSLGEAKGLVQEAGGVGNAFKAVAKEVPKALYEGVVPEAGRQLISGDIEGARKTVTNDPVGSVAPLVFGAKGGAGMVGKGAAFDAGLARTAQVVTKPVGAVVGKTGGAIADVAGKTTRFGVSQATGLKPETVSQVLKTPEAFSKEAMAGISRKNLGDEVKAKLDEKSAALDDTGEGYRPVRDLQAINKEVSPEIVKTVSMRDSRKIVYNLVDAPMESLTLPELRKRSMLLEQDPSAPKALLNKTNKEIGMRETTETIPHPIKVNKQFLDHVIKGTTGVEITRDGQIVTSGRAKIRDRKDIAALQDLRDLFAPIFEGGKMTVDEYLNFRQHVGKKLARFDRDIGKSSDLDRVGQEIYGKFNEKYRNQVPGLEPLDAEFSVKKTEFDRLKAELFDKDGNLLKTATDKIANSLGRGQRKADFLDKLEEISPGITQKIQVLKAIEDIQDSSGIKVGTYARGALLGGSAVLGGIIPAVVTAILTSPESAVPIMRQYGLLKNSQAVQEVLKQLSAGATNINAIPSHLNMDVKKLEGVKMPMGLSMEDVSKKKSINPKDFNNPEDYVKAQGEPMYRGTQVPQSGELASADTYGLAYGKGVYLAKDKAFAEQYGKNISELYPSLKKPLVMSEQAPMELIDQVKKDYPNWSDRFGTTGEDIHSFIGGSADEANAYLQKLGYDGLLDAASEGAKQTIVFDPKNIKTKSQLMDEWKGQSAPAKTTLGKSNPAVGKTVKGLTPEQNKTLAAVHNTTSQKLRMAEKIGGFANPSVGIFNPLKGDFESFGDITLVAPKDLLFSAKAKTFASDIYSPRFPSTSTTVNYAKLDAVQKRTGIEFGKYQLDDFYRSAENDASTMKAFLEKEGKDVSGIDTSTYIGKDNLRMMIEPIREGFDNFIEDLGKEVGAGEKIFKGFTNLGNRRYADLTVENASKHMNAQDLKGGENFFYGLGSIRARISPQLKNVKDIKKSENKIVSSAEFEKLKEQYETQFHDVTYELEKYSKHKDKNQFIQSDNVALNLGQYLAGDRMVMKDFFGNVPDTLLSKIEDFRRTLIDMPTEYFETKFKRPVEVGEFSHAVVPDNTGPETIKLLEGKGIEVVKYQPGKGNQTKKLAEIAAQAGLLFGIVGMVETKDQ